MWCVGSICGGLHSVSVCRELCKTYECAGFLWVHACVSKSTFSQNTASHEYPAQCSYIRRMLLYYVVALSLCEVLYCLYIYVCDNSNNNNNDNVYMTSCGFMICVFTVMMNSLCRCAELILVAVSNKQKEVKN